jgi:hypothetical protein
MAQPGRGSHGAAPTAAPISEKKVQVTFHMAISV